jgi:hypothetical protein
MIKSRRMIWVKHEACMWNSKYWFKNLKGRDTLGDLGVGVINPEDGGDMFC